MGSSTRAPKPPDTSRYSQGMENMSQQMQTWAADMYSRGQQEWQQLSDWSGQVMGMTLPAMEDSFSWAKEQRDRFDEHVMPQMQSLFSEAELYASKAEEDRQRGAAIQDVKSASEAQREAQQRQLEGYGIDPSETRYAALDKQAGVAEAAMSALAANQAGERTKQIGRDLRSEAIGVGSQFLSDAAQSYQTGSYMGASGLGSASGATSAGVGASGAALPYMSGAVTSLDRGAGIVDQGYQRELDYAQDARDAEAADASGWGGIGSMVGAGMSFIPGLGTLGKVASGALSNTRAADGGPVSAPGGPTDDAGALAISDGEYIIPADVVRKLGTNHFDKMIEKETGRPPPAQNQAIPIPQGAR